VTNPAANRQRFGWERGATTVSLLINGVEVSVTMFRVP